MKKLKWLEITLDNERRQHHQSKATVAVLEERLAESQAWTARMSTYLKMERERGDTYKRLFEDRRGVEEDWRQYLPQVDIEIEAISKKIGRDGPHMGGLKENVV